MEELSRENEEEKGVELEHSQYARKTAPIEYLETWSIEWNKVVFFLLATAIS